LNNINKNILIVTSEFPPQPGGIGNHAYNLAKYLQINKFKVEVIADQRSNSGREEFDFDKEQLFVVHRVKINRLRMFMYIKRVILLFRLIKTFEIVIATGKFPLWVVALSSFIYNRKFIAVIHGSEVNFSNSLLNKSISKALKRFTKIIAVSNYTKSLIAHLNYNNCVVIPNGIDKEKWQLDELSMLDVEGEPSLITVGNITDRKGQLNVIKQLPKLLEVFPNLRYHCVGLPTQKEEFINVAEALGVRTHIIFHGRVSSFKLKQLLKSSDIFVMLSSPTNTGDVEGFGIAIIEANYLGLPCVGSQNCGIEDAISNYKSGILIPYNNHAEFILAIQHILTNYDVYKNHSKKWAEQHDWSIIIKKYIKEISS